jgi:hypothetical protein
VGGHEQIGNHAAVCARDEQCIWFLGEREAAELLRILRQQLLAKFDDAHDEFAHGLSQKG